MFKFMITFIRELASDFTKQMASKSLSVGTSTADAMFIPRVMEDVIMARIPFACIISAEGAPKSRVSVRDMTFNPPRGTQSIDVKYGVAYLSYNQMLTIRSTPCVLQC